jgi:hypothetical protein
MKILLFLLAYLMLFANMLYAQIYKWEDKKGVIHFSDNPPTENVKDDKQLSRNEDSRYQYEKTYEEYQKEKREK